MTEIMGQKPASAYQSPYAPKASASTIQATGLDAALQANQSQPQPLTAISSGMLGSAGNPVGNSTQVGSGVTNGSVPSFSDTPGAKSPSLPASPTPTATTSSTATPSASGLSATTPAVASTATPTANINAYGNDISEAARINGIADQMKKDREATYASSALPETPTITPTQPTNPFGDTPMGQKMFAGLANQSLGKGYSGLAGIGALMGGTDGLPSGNFGDRARRNKILNERGQQYMNGLGTTQTV